ALNQIEGLCNDTRLIVTRLGKWSIGGDIISGTNIGQNVTIPRIIMSPNESRWPFKLNRRQLPLAPCFAMTINKSQGQSLKYVGLYLPKQVFTNVFVKALTNLLTEKTTCSLHNALEFWTPYIHMSILWCHFMVRGTEQENQKGLTSQIHILLYGRSCTDSIHERNTTFTQISSRGRFCTKGF
ncbi:hypothetical protein CISIN_1g047352mg, partial [Citrus sinensis]